MARISGGAWRGRTLGVPPSIRATAEKVRQALYNILGDSVEGARVLEGFAGSGALGLEALSRGASFAAFVESDPEAVLCIQDNLERLGIDRNCRRLMHLEWERALPVLASSEAPFDLVLLDPPYRGEEAKKALIALDDYAILARAGLVVIEHDRRTGLPASTSSLRALTQHRYGDTVLSLYQPVRRRRPQHDDTRHLPRDV
jgi:16S rRNA (guanine966-N2)-methyltransferase